MNTKYFKNIYILHIRSVTENYSTIFQSSPTAEQSCELESFQETELRVMLGDMYMSFDAAMEMTGLKALQRRHKDCCLTYILKAVKHPVRKAREDGVLSRNDKPPRSLDGWALCQQLQGVLYHQSILHHLNHPPIIPQKFK